LKKFSKDFQNFNQGGFYPCFFVVLILMQPFAVLRIPAAPAQNPVERDFVGLRLAPATG